MDPKVGSNGSKNGVKGHFRNLRERKEKKKEEKKENNNIS